MSNYRAFDSLRGDGTKWYIKLGIVAVVGLLLWLTNETVEFILRLYLS